MGIFDSALIHLYMGQIPPRRIASSRGEMVALEARFTTTYDGTTFNSMGWNGRDGYSQAVVDNNIAAIYPLLYLEHLISQSSLKVSYVVILLPCKFCRTQDSDVYGLRDHMRVPRLRYTIVPRPLPSDHL